MILLPVPKVSVSSVTSPSSPSTSSSCFPEVSDTVFSSSTGSVISSCSTTSSFVTSSCSFFPGITKSCVFPRSSPSVGVNSLISSWPLSSNWNCAFVSFSTQMLYFSCCNGVNGLYCIFSLIASNTYFPSLNHKMRSSHSSRHSDTIPASLYNFASSYAHFSTYSTFLNSTNASICFPIGAFCAFKILYFKIYLFGSFGATFTNSS